MSSSSSISLNSKCNGDFPTHCKCNPPLLLKKRTSWTPANPARRFLTCPNSMSAWKRCGAYWFIDEELTNEWYKLNLYQLYSSLNRDQTELFREGMRIRERLDQLNEEFEVYKSKKDQELVELQMELHTVKSNSVLLKKCVIALLFVVGLLVICK